MILRSSVQGGQGTMPASPLLSLPTFTQFFVKNNSISFIFSFQEQQKCVFKVIGEAKMQVFPPVPTMVAPTISTYVNNKILVPTLLKTCSGP